jgi:ferredoxin
MKIKITDDCINCGACEIECPVNAVYPKANPGLIKLMIINNIYSHSGFISDKHYYINPNECYGCKTVFDIPRCNTVCPMACCLTENEHYGAEFVKIAVNPVSNTKIGLN